MAMSETPSKPIDWTQFYHLSSGQAVAQPAPSSAVADSIVVTATATTTANNHHPGGGPAANPNYAQIEGRVGKTGRRRSRASRRAPTTLLNTDTTNFRAMVQQFTGVPTVPFSSTSAYNQPPSATTAAGAGGNMTAFGFGPQHARRQHTLLTTTPTPTDYYHPRAHHQLQQQQQQQQQQQEVPFSSLGPLGHRHDHQSFHPVFTNPRPTSDFSEDFLEILSSSSTTPGHSNNNTTANTHGYIL